MPSEKTLKRIVITLGVLIVFGFMTLVGIIIYRLVNPKVEVEEPIEVDAGRIDLILNASKVRLVKQSQNENFIVLVLEDKDANQTLMIFDAKTQEIVGYFPLEDVDEDIAKLADPD